MQQGDEILIAKDGYIFNYCDYSENKEMLAQYNKMVKSIRKIKLLPEFPKNELYFLDSILEENTPVYLFYPRSKEDVDSLNPYKRLILESILDKDGNINLDVNKKYLMYWTDSLGEWYISIIPLSEIENDIEMLKSFLKNCE